MCVVKRFQVRSDSLTSYQKVKKRAYNGDVAEFCESVMLTEGGKHMEKLDDSWQGSVLWLGGMALATATSIRRLPMRSRWSAEAVRELEIKAGGLLGPTSGAWG